MMKGSKKFDRKEDNFKNQLIKKKLKRQSLLNSGKKITFHAIRL